MKRKLNISEEILIQADVMNTMYGGMSEPQLDIQSHEEGYEVKIKTPGIEADALQIEILQDKLMVYHVLPVFSKVRGEKSAHQTARFISRMVIPSDVDLENISARYDEESRCLKVVFPFNNLHQDFHRRVDIERF
ncbi:Hsp20/alpha crystallin family protein [Arundinibacter roseus]|nr:Hsp20/alpha crystallin family protein [Arundinibacter roseus]